jgi:predicted DNA-binding transcriptional regulator AlpA
MRPDSSTCDVKAAGRRTMPVTMSPWVNERCPPLHEILSAHDVARLTRRPRWLLCGLTLIGRFPRRQCYHGRALGWRRAEVLEWMARGLAVVPEGERLNALRRCARRHPRQACLPLECRGPCRLARSGAKR